MVSATEIAVPMAMMWVLSIIHTQIVSTSSDPEQTKKIYEPHKRRNYRRRRRIRFPTTNKPTCDSYTYMRKDDSKAGAADNKKASHSKSVIFQSANKIKESDIRRSSEEINVINNVVRQSNAGIPLDDDGFESFNGNGSSPSDNYEDAKVPKRSSLDLRKASSDIICTVYANLSSLGEIGECSKQCLSDGNDKKCNEWVNSITSTPSADANVGQHYAGCEAKESSKETNSDTDTNKTSTSTKRTSRVRYLFIKFPHD